MCDVRTSNGPQNTFSAKKNGGSMIRRLVYFEFVVVVVRYLRRRKPRATMPTSMLTSDAGSGTER